jgi:hypothetical protein
LVRERERSLWKARRKCEDNIEIDLKETDYDVMDWVHVAQDRYRWRALVDTVMNLKVP